MKVSDEGNLVAVLLLRVLCKRFCYFVYSLYVLCILLCQPEKTTDAPWRHHWFPRKMTSERRSQKFLTDDTSLVHVLLIGLAAWEISLYQSEAPPDLGSDASSVCSVTSPLVSPENDVWETIAEIPYWWHVSSTCTSDWSCRVGNFLVPVRSTSWSG